MGSKAVVVGGGVIGSSVVFATAALAQKTGKSVEITLVEGSEVASGASGKAGGLLALDWHGHSTASLAELSYTLHAALAKQYDGASRWGYRRLDTLSISADLSSTGKARTSRKLKGADVFPWLNKDVLTGSDILGSPDTTAQVHPEQFTRAMVELAQERGVKLVLGTATKLQKPSSPNEPYRLTVQSRDAAGEERVLEADQIVIAAGPWTGRLLGELDLRSKAGRAAGIEGSRAHSVVLKTAPGRDLPAQAVFTSIKTKSGHAEPEIYNRPDGTAYACGPTDGSPLPTHASSVTVDDRAISLLLQQTAHLSPDHLDSTEAAEGGARAEVVKRQACFLPVGSGDPVIGWIDGVGDKGVLVASGHSCWGICNGPGTGQVVAELLLEGKAKSANISSLRP
ncbi:hypothetical protein JCM8547_005654 [Rhodosporidiobolus lusitaniae]